MEARASTGHGVGADAHLATANAQPLVRVPQVARIAGVHPNHDVEVLHPLPERVELGKRERLPSLPRRDGRNAQQEDLGAPLVDELELLEGAVEYSEADDRGRVDRVRSHVAPVLVHPLVEGMDDGRGGIGIVGEPLLDRTGECGPEQRSIDAHLFHQLQTGLGIEERIDARHDHHLLPRSTSDRREPAASFGDVQAHGAWRGHLHEGGIGDVVADQIADRQLGAAVDVDVLDDPVVLGRQKLGQRIAVLVEVIVGIEGRVRQLAVHDADVLVETHGVLLSVISTVPQEARRAS